MPNRILKESICTSDSINELDWFSEVLFYRLIVNCDDFGRFDGRTAVIKNRLFPLKESITLKNVETAINKLAFVGLVVPYQSGGKPFLFLPTWNEHQSIRAKKSKYPEPEIICNQMQSSESKCPRNPIQSESNPNPNPNARERAGAHPPELTEMGFSDGLTAKVSEWLQYKQERNENYKPTGLRNLLSEIKNNATQYGDDAVANLIGECMSSGYKGIMFDRLSRRSGKQIAPVPKTEDRQASAAALKGDLDRLYKSMDGGGA